MHTTSMKMDIHFYIDVPNFVFCNISGPPYLEFYYSNATFGYSSLYQRLKSVQNIS